MEEPSKLLTVSNRKWTLISIVYFLLECMIDQSMFKVPKNSLCLMLRHLSFMKNNMHFKGQELFGPFVIVCRNSPTQCFSRDKCGPMYLLFLQSRSAKTFFFFLNFWNFTEFYAQERYSHRSKFLKNMKVKEIFSEEVSISRKIIIIVTIYHDKDDYEIINLEWF